MEARNSSESNSNFNLNVSINTNINVNASLNDGINENEAKNTRIHINPTTIIKLQNINNSIASMGKNTLRKSLREHRRSITQTNYYNYNINLNCSNPTEASQGTSKDNGRNSITKTKCVYNINNTISHMDHHETSSTHKNSIQKKKNNILKIRSKNSVKIRDDRTKQIKSHGPNAIDILLTSNKKQLVNKFQEDYQLQYTQLMNICIKNEQIRLQSQIHNKGVPSSSNFD